MHEPCMQLACIMHAACNNKHAQRAHTTVQRAQIRSRSHPTHRGEKHGERGPLWGGAYGGRHKAPSSLHSEGTLTASPVAEACSQPSARQPHHNPLTILVASRNGVQVNVKPPPKHTCLAMHSCMVVRSRTKGGNQGQRPQLGRDHTQPLTPPREIR